MTMLAPSVGMIGTNVDGVIDKEAHTITVTLPENVTLDDVMAMTPNITPVGITVSPENYNEDGALDYKQPQVLTIGGVAYTVTVQEADNGPKGISGFRMQVLSSTAGMTIVEGVIDQAAHTITVELPETFKKSEIIIWNPYIDTYNDADISPTPYGGENGPNYADPVELIVSGITYTVTVNEATITPPFQGTGTETDPYLIPDAAALVKLSEEYNEYPLSYTNAWWKQTANIDMSGIDWVPIGETYNNRFMGVYDGGEFEIHNLTIEYSGEAAGLFGIIGEGATIKNVILKDDCYIKSSSVAVGGIVGEMQRNERSFIENCINFADVVSEYNSDQGSVFVGGICGGALSTTTSQIINCNNYGSVQITQNGKNGYVGGIVGSSCLSIIHCANYGDVYCVAGSGSNAAGIAAFDSGGVIVGCFNSGAIKGGRRIGGIVADAGMSTKVIESCYNVGNIIGDNALASECSIGGIVGEFSSHHYLSNCYSIGTVSASADVDTIYSGAVVGYASNSNTILINRCFYMGSDDTSAFGKVSISTAEATKLSSKELQSAETVAVLNDYPEPRSLYKTTWSVDSDNVNGGYPVIQSVTPVPSYHAEINSFTVTLNGNTYSGTIEGNEIRIVLPYGTTIVNPAVTVSDKATVSPVSGASVDLSSGPATYTVTAENGKQILYSVKAMIPESPDGLAALRLYTSRAELLPSESFTSDIFEYSCVFNDRALISDPSITATDIWFSAIPSEPGAALSARLNEGTSKKINPVSNLNSNGGRLRLYGPGYEEPIQVGENTVALVVSPPDGGIGAETTYTLKLTVVPTLAALGLTNADSGAALNLTPAFDPAVTEYTLDIPEGTENLTISAEAYLPDIEDVILPGGYAEGKLPVSGEGFDILVGKGENVTTYHIAYASLPSYTASVSITPSDAVIAINDPNGNYVRPEADGSYKLTVSYTYQYTAAKVGYATVTGSFTHDTTADYTLTVTLAEVSNSGQDAAASDWPSFRGNEQNLGVTSAFTPVSTEESELLWAAALGTGYSNAPSIPILVDGKLIVMSSNKIFKLSLEDCSILQSADMVKAIDWGYTPATYANGMIFAPLTDGTVQAFDAETLESLWVYTDPLGGQSVSPIYYYDGYVYTGFWNSEVHDAAYVCLPVTDEDPSSQNEAKTALWRDVHLGGFYWAGAVAVGDYLVYGSDDGVREGQNGTATLYSRNRITGVLCDTEELVGDQRSSIAYADGKLYFTTKKGNLYQAALNTDGTFASLKVYQMGGMATGTPVVYSGLVFANSLDGENQFGDPGATYVLNAADLSLVTKAQNKFYNQSSLLLSTAYADEGKFFLYGTYNGTPGGMEVLVYDTSAKTLTVEDFFIPDSDKQEYGICSPICDANGTIYYKNDSAYVFAIANKNADELAAKAADELIDAIGTVTLESKDKIDAARAAYDALTDAQKDLTTKLAVLLAAEAKYAELKAAADNLAAAKAADDLINAIGTVTLESKAKITAARAAYDALTVEQKALAEKLPILEAAEAKYEELAAAASQAEIDQAAAKGTDDLIAAIGTVTLDSEQAITAARNAYDALTDGQKALVTKLDVLTAAEAKLAELKADKAAAEAAEEKIAAIGTVTLESENAITAARNAYDALTAGQKALVTKLDVLTAAEAKLAELKADKAAAEAVEEKIAAIGEVTKESEDAITAARTAYDALTDTQKALVSSLSVLTAAESKLQELKNSGSSGSGTSDKKLHVTMRLIGAELAAKDVNLGAEAYLPNYVTWIPTTAYELKEGATVYDLWVLATSEWDISSYGAERNYVSTVYAPSGYALSEFTNGARSGWMYTINGSHPGYGLKEQKLSDGDVVIWHYINDYSYECADWFSEANWPSLATDARYYNLWLQAPDYQGGAGGGIGGSGSGSGFGGSGSSGGSGSGTVTETEPEGVTRTETTVEGDDGSTSTTVTETSSETVTNEDGSVTETNTEKVTETVTDVDGSVTKTETVTENETTTNTVDNADGSTTETAATTETVTETVTAEDGSKAVTETATETKVETTTTENEDGSTTVSTVTETKETSTITVTDAEGNETTSVVETTETRTVETTVDAEGKVTGSGTVSSSATVTDENGEKSTVVTEGTVVVDTDDRGTVSEVTTAKTTTTAADGTKTEATTVTTDSVAADGCTGKTVEDENGKTLSAEATVSEEALEKAKETGEPVSLPVSVNPTQDEADAPMVSVYLPYTEDETAVEVEIEVTLEGSGIVALIRQPSGALSVDSKCRTGSVIVSVSGNCDIVIVDNSKYFSDVEDGSWFKDSVTYVTAREIFNGYDTGAFGPNDKMNRAMAAQIIYNLEKGKPVSGNQFSDVAADAWYAPAVGWAAENGIVTGADGAYRPLENITRQDLVVILYRYAKMAKYDRTIDRKVMLSNYADGTEVASYAADAMRWAITHGLITGYEDGSLRPKNTATRAEVAAMIQRLIQNVVR